MGLRGMSDMVLLHQVNSEENLTLVVYSSALAMELLQSSAKAFDVMFLRSSSFHNGGLYSVFILTQAPPSRPHTLRPEKMATISQMTLSNAFSWMKMLECRLKISLKFVHKGPVTNIPALIPIMAWCRAGA